MKRSRLLFISNLFPDQTEPYRGLDNATVLHALSKQWDVEVLALRPTLKTWLSKPAATYTARSQDEVFKPRYLGVKYVPKVGGFFNHHLMRRAIEREWNQHGKQLPYDVILTSWLYPDAAATASLLENIDIPLVCIAQGSDVHRYLSSQPRRSIILDAVKQAKAVITRSESLAKLLHDAGADKFKLHPIWNGVDTTTFHFGEQAKARHQLGIDPDRKLLLFVGNLLPVKNPHMLLRAFAKLFTKHPHWPLQLAFAGRGPLRNSLQNLAAELGVSDLVRFLGPQDSQSVAEWMRAADLLCMSSRNEGLPNVVLEAMASGLPVLATDVGGIHEIINEPWKGKLVPEGREDAYVAALEELLDSQLERSTIAAFGETLSWKATATSYQAILENALVTNA